MKQPIRFLLICGLALTGFVPLFSQKKVLVGVNVNSDYYSDAIRPSLGLTLETHFTKHSGLESGIYYRADRSHTTFFTADSTGASIYPLIISQRFINVPLLYKYYSKAVNVSAGPLLDFYTSWKQKRPHPGVLVNSFTVHPILKLGFLGKVSKTFALDKAFLLEPEIRVGFLRYSNELGAGVGLSAKYRF